MADAAGLHLDQHFVPARCGDFALHQLQTSLGLGHSHRTHLRHRFAPSYSPTDIARWGPTSPSYGGIGAVEQAIRTRRPERANNPGRFLAVSSLTRQPIGAFLEPDPCAAVFSNVL